MFRWTSSKDNGQTLKGVTLSDKCLKNEWIFHVWITENWMSSSVTDEPFLIYLSGLFYLQILDLHLLIVSIIMTTEQHEVALVKCAWALMAALQSAVRVMVLALWSVLVWFKLPFVLLLKSFSSKYFSLLIELRWLLWTEKSKPDLHRLAPSDLLGRKWPLNLTPRTSQAVLL